MIPYYNIEHLKDYFPLAFSYIIWARSKQELGERLGGDVFHLHLLTRVLLMYERVGNY